MIGVMEAMDKRARVPKTFRLGVGDVAKAAGVEPSVVRYNRVKIGDLVAVSEFVVGMRMMARIKERRNGLA